MNQATNPVALPGAKSLKCQTCEKPIESDSSDPNHVRLDHDWLRPINDGDFDHALHFAATDHPHAGFREIMNPTDA